MPSPLGQTSHLTSSLTGLHRISPGPGTAAETLSSRKAESAPLAETGPSEKADRFTFGDFLDVINPLQHIPVVGTIYRHITGDEIKSGSRIAGDTLFGGLIGFAVGAANALLEDRTGKDAGEHVMAFFGIGEDKASRDGLHLAARSQGKDLGPQDPPETEGPASQPLQTASLITGQTVDAAALFTARPDLARTSLTPAGLKGEADARALRSAGQTIPGRAPSLPADFLARLQSSWSALDQMDRAQVLTRKTEKYAVD